MSAHTSKKNDNRYFDLSSNFRSNYTIYKEGHYLYYPSVVILFLFISFLTVFDLNNLVLFVKFIFFAKLRLLIKNFYFFLIFLVLSGQVYFLVNVSIENIQIFSYYFTHIFILPSKWKERD